MSKYIIKNCPCFVEGIAIKGNEQKTQTCNNHKVRELTLCQDCTDCVMKKIVELCREADGKVVGYTKGKVYDSDTEKLIEADVPLMTKNPLAEEILDLLDIQECE